MRQRGLCDPLDCVELCTRRLRLQPGAALGGVKIRPLQLGLPLLGDIGVGAEPAHNVPTLIADGQRTRKKPSVLSVAAPEREGVLPSFPSLLAMPFPQGNNPLHVLGLMDFGPTPPAHLLEACARVVIPAAVEPEDPPARVRHPRNLRDVVGERAEPLLAFSERLLCFFAGSDVHAYAPHSNRLAGVVTHDAPTRTNPVHTAIWPDDAVLEVVLAANK